MPDKPEKKKWIQNISNFQVIIVTVIILFALIGNAVDVAGWFISPREQIYDNVKNIGDLRNAGIYCTKFIDSVNAIQDSSIAETNRIAKINRMAMGEMYTNFRKYLKKNGWEWEETDGDFEKLIKRFDKEHAD